MLIINKTTLQPKEVLRIFLVFVLLLSISEIIMAVASSWKKTGTEGTLPLGSKNYVNLFNGRLNFTLPLLELNGRGKSGYSIPLSIQNTIWRKYVHYEPHYFDWLSEPGTQICTTQIVYTAVTVDGETTGGLEGSGIQACHTEGGTNGGSVALDPYQYPIAYLDDLE